MSDGRVESIFVTGQSGEPMVSRAEATAVAGAGLEGDRHWQGAGATARKRGPDREITLIEAEAIEAFCAETGVALEPVESRRNVVTRGVRLNPLVGREFSVGGARLHGLRLCEPCDHLEDLTRPGVCAGLVHRGGLRARVVVGGRIQTGDAVTVDA